MSEGGWAEKAVTTASKSTIHELAVKLAPWAISGCFWWVWNISGDTESLKQDHVTAVEFAELKTEVRLEKEGTKEQLKLIREDVKWIRDKLTE